MKGNDGTGNVVYNGTISRIEDLTRSNYSSDGANNLAYDAVATDTDPGKLHVYATGFRNPYGVRLTGTGEVWATDNGGDPPVETSDFVYRAIRAGDVGNFPPGGATHQPLAPLGVHHATAGLDFIRSGPDAGRALVCVFSVAIDLNAGNFAPGYLALVDGSTGRVSTFIAAFGNPIDLVADPQGRLVIADYGPNYYNGDSTASGGIYLLERK